MFQQFSLKLWTTIVFSMIMLCGCQKHGSSNNQIKELDPNEIISDTYSSLLNESGDVAIEKLLSVLNHKNIDNLSYDNITKLMICGIFIEYQKNTGSLISYPEYQKKQVEFYNKFNNISKNLQNKGVFSPNNLNDRIVKLSTSDQNIARRIIGLYKEEKDKRLIEQNINQAYEMIQRDLPQDQEQYLLSIIEKIKDFNPSNTTSLDILAKYTAILFFLEDNPIDTRYLGGDEGDIYIEFYDTINSCFNFFAKTMEDVGEEKYYNEIKKLNGEGRNQLERACDTYVDYLRSYGTSHFVYGMNIASAYESNEHKAKKDFPFGKNLFVKVQAIGVKDYDEYGCKYKISCIGDVALYTNDRKFLDYDYPIHIIFRGKIKNISPFGTVEFVDIVPLQITPCKDDFDY